MGLAKVDAIKFAGGTSVSGVLEVDESGTLALALIVLEHANAQWLDSLALEKILNLALISVKAQVAHEHGAVLVAGCTTLGTATITVGALTLATEATTVAGLAHATIAH